MVVNIIVEDVDGVWFSFRLMIFVNYSLKKIIIENNLKMKLFKENCVVCDVFVL